MATHIFTSRTEAADYVRDEAKKALGDYSDDMMQSVSVAIQDTIDGSASVNDLELSITIQEYFVYNEIDQTVAV